MNIAFIVLGCAVLFDVADRFASFFDPPVKTGQFASQHHTFRK
jgi:hypothetical protein